jgi:hypothetical protein
MAYIEGTPRQWYGLEVQLRCGLSAFIYLQ